MRKIIIAIDGPSSTGKSTLARRLAQALDYVYVDTGAMYRTVTLYALENGLIGQDFEDDEGLISQLDQLHIAFKNNPESGMAEIHLNETNVEGDIRNLKVSRKVSQIAAIPEVREKLVEQQQRMGVEKGLVMDGRDIGTVVFPSAELKLFMTASPEKRAQRRYKELLDRGEAVSYQDVLKNVRERDYLDSTRKTSPLRKAEDAIAFDNSDMGLDEQFERTLDLAHRIIEKTI